MKKRGKIAGDFGRRIAEALADKSDRACVILVASWAEHCLKVKLELEFAKGNAEARSTLFAANGPFATFAGNTNVAFCAEWIDPDVYHDLGVIRGMRNKFAHSVDAKSLCDEPFRTMVAKLRVPRREYYDWGTLRAAAAGSGVALFTGEPPDDATEEVEVSGLVFRLGASVLMAVLVANLGLPIDAGESTGPVLLELPEHMREIPG